MIGTNWFANLDWAVLYYRPYGYSLGDVKGKVSRGEINIGRLPHPYILDSQGRYWKPV